MTPHAMHTKQQAKPKVIVSFLSVICLCFIFIISSAVAASPEKISVVTGGHQKLNLTVGKSTIIESTSLIKKFAVAKPEQLDVTILSPRQVYLIGKTPGTTSATIWGVDGKVIAVLDIEIMPDVSLLKEKIHAMLPNEKDIKVTASPDATVLAGTVSNTANLSQVITMANAYSPKVINLLEVGGVHQVMLEVRVSEMSRTLMQRLGVNFNVNYSSSGNTFALSFLKDVANLPNSQLGAFFHTGSVNWTVLIDALKENGLTKVLAEPTLITTSGKTANFLAGGEYPIPVPQTSGGGGNVITIEYKTFGVGLNFTPTVLSNNKISMEVQPEVSELDFTNSLNISGYVVPSLTTRRVSTTIELADGQSFAVAGLLKDELREVISKFPVLGDIPILGALFRSSSFQNSETELVIIVTPHLVKPIDMAKQTLPTDAFVAPNDFEFFLLGSLEGRDGSAKSSNRAVTPRSGEGGLDGDFGHIAPK